jgi:hypothetical protein
MAELVSRNLAKAAKRKADQRAVAECDSSVTALPKFNLNAKPSIRLPRLRLTSERGRFYRNGGQEMQFRLVRTEYDRKTARAYIELRTADADGGDAIATAIFSFKTSTGLSKNRREEDLVRKARHVLKSAAASP